MDNPTELARGDIDATILALLGNEAMMISDNIDGNFDLNSDGVDDVTAIFKVSGANKLNASAAIGISGTLTFAMNNGADTELQINYNSSDTANTIIKKINWIIIIVII